MNDKFGYSSALGLKVVRRANVNKHAPVAIASSRTQVVEAKSTKTLVSGKKA